MAVWALEQLVDFLNFVRDDRLFALWWLVALRGLRRAAMPNRIAVSGSPQPILCASG
ncbi:hypothetical protein ABZ297_24920 [Nonomuraea sp. NPDC005983]|uniref:hypothetical protein n=1 Tax=Nonomuraea sp. NPDC005983 TaxID=3155595 RepID=UPI00339DBBFC